MGLPPYPPHRPTDLRPLTFSITVSMNLNGPDSALCLVSRAAMHIEKKHMGLGMHQRQHSDI